MALEDMVNAMAMPGGVTYDEYLRSCLAPVPIQDKVQKVSEEDLGKKIIQM